MAVSEKIFEALTSIVKTNDEIKHLNENIRMLFQEVREIDRRLIRIETMIEFSEKNHLHKRIKS